MENTVNCDTKTVDNVFVQIEVAVQLQPIMTQVSGCHAAVLTTTKLLPFYIVRCWLRPSCPFLDRATHCALGCAVVA
jgi:hypothetical protein